MIYIISKYDLLNEFRISSLEFLESHLNSMAPSICEYHLENIILYSDICDYINKNQISKELYCGNFIFYFDYDNNIYLQQKYTASTEDESTSSLW